MKPSDLVINGRTISSELRTLDIFSVDYYFDNPRVNYAITGTDQGPVTSEMVERALLRLDSTRELIQSIETNGGLIEAVMVYNNKVIEGNTRLCAMRRLYSRTKDERWRRIKAQVLTDEIDQNEIFAILSHYHIKGKTPWDAYEKAACIAKMVEAGQTVEEVARVVGSTKPRVENVMKAFEAMRDKYLPAVKKLQDNAIDDREELRKFSYFDAFFTDKALAKRSEETPKFVDTFVDWLLEGRITKAQEVRKLEGVLCNKKARTEFLHADAKCAFEDALQVLHYNEPDKLQGFYREVRRFRNLLMDQAPEKVRHETTSNQHMKNELRCCLNDLQKFCKEVGL